MLVITVANLKGGTGKTTSAAFVAHVLHEIGHRVLLVDADPQASALTWSDAADWQFPVIGKPSVKLNRELPGIAGSQFDAAVIDTPPNEERKGIVTAAVLAATHVLIPIAPTGGDHERMRALRELLDDSAVLRPDGLPPAVGVLLVKAVPRAASTSAYRDLMTDDGWSVLSPTIGRLERFAQAFGEPVTRALETGYGDAVTELLALEPKEVMST